MADSQTFEFTLTGKSPLIMHFDNIDGMEEIDRWRKDHMNKPLCVKGDDRSPAWTWIAYLYIGDGKVVMPSDNVMTAMRKAGAAKEIPNGKHGKTFKDATQYGIIPSGEAFEFFNQGKSVSATAVSDLWGDNDFAKHEEMAGDLGFKLFKKRAKIGQSKHIRVRPMFMEWSVKGSFVVTEPAITESVLVELMDIAGDRVGFCDWRPSSKTPGPYGRFNAVIERVA